MNNRDKIIALIEANGQQSIKQLSQALEISRSMTHRHVRVLLDTGKIQKIGAAPQVFYIIALHKKEASNVNIDRSTKEIIDQNFLYISARGERIDGWSGFNAWCDKRDFNVIDKSEEYIKIYRKYDALKKNGSISGKEKIENTFGSNLCLADVFYAEFYAWEVFGKTKLGQLLLYAKQSQDKKIMREVIAHISPVIKQLSKIKKIDAVGFIPPTVKRQTQFMKVLQETLGLRLPIISIVKVQTEVITPQKTLNKLQDRIENADSTIVVTDTGQYKNVLLIDDAVGSGATLNQTACKVKKTGIAQKVFGFALTGSVKGFNVISEV